MTRFKVQGSQANRMIVSILSCHLVICIFPHFSELKNEKLFMLMEKGEMDLEKYLHLNKSLKCEEIRNLWIQMLCAVNSIHKQGIIHTDLKPANFLFVNSTLKLIDFGIAKGLQVRFCLLSLQCII